MANVEQLEQVTSLVLQFLESKSFFNAERALRAELALALEACEQDEEAMKASGACAQPHAMTHHHLLTSHTSPLPRSPSQTHNLFTSKLEAILGIKGPGPEPVPTSSPIRDLTPPLNAMNAAAAERAAESGLDDEPGHGPSASATQLGAPQFGPRPRVRLYDLSLFSASNAERVLRKHYGHGTPQTRVIFHDPPNMSDGQAADLAHISLNATNANLEARRKGKQAAKLDSWGGQQ